VISPEPIDGMQSTGRGFWRPGALKLPAEAQFGRRCGTPLLPLPQLSPSDRTGALPQIPPSDLDIPVLGQPASARRCSRPGCAVGSRLPRTAREWVALGVAAETRAAPDHAPVLAELDGLPVYSAIQRGTILTSSML
jgi:hypothetical protein